MKTDPKVDAFFGALRQWDEESRKLRSITLECGLSETLKWGQPCYTSEGRNIVLIGGFKDYCVLLFFKGALLKDPKGILATPGQTQAGRQIRFTSLGEIVGMEPVVKAYIREAIDIENSGLKVPMKKTADFTIPEEFQTKLDELPALKTAFEALTPGRQRAYIFHFSGPKQSKTRESRVEKCIPNIFGGKGLDD